MLLPSGSGLVKWGDNDQRIYTSSYKRNKFWGYNVQFGDYSYQGCIIYLKVAERVDLKKWYQRLTEENVLDV